MPHQTLILKALVLTLWGLTFSIKITLHKRNLLDKFLNKFAKSIPFLHQNFPDQILNALTVKKN